MSKEFHKEKNEELRKTSGSINHKDPLVSILYTILRDGHISPGTLESLVREQERCTIENGDSGILDVQFSNGWLAKYARNLSERIRGRR